MRTERDSGKIIREKEKGSILLMSFLTPQKGNRADGRGKERRGGRD